MAAMQTTKETVRGDHLRSHHFEGIGSVLIVLHLHNQIEGQDITKSWIRGRRRIATRSEHAAAGSRWGDFMGQLPKRWLPLIGGAVLAANSRYHCDWRDQQLAWACTTCFPSSCPCRYHFWNVESNKFW